MSEVKLDPIDQITTSARRLEGKRSSSLVVVSVLAVRLLNDLLLKVQTSLSTTLTLRLPKALQTSFVGATATAAPMPYAGDVTGEDFNENMVKATVEQYGELDSFVANAG